MAWFCPGYAMVDPPAIGRDLLTQAAAESDVLGAQPATVRTQRAVVVLRYRLDWSVEQSAAALGVAPGTVKSRMHRALAALRTAMEASDAR
jgi:DNA-directed RNA polymerase specialized sigma24 family protein